MLVVVSVALLIKRKDSVCKEMHQRLATTLSQAKTIVFAKLRDLRSKEPTSRRTSPIISVETFTHVHMYTKLHTCIIVTYLHNCTLAHLNTLILEHLHTCTPVPTPVPAPILQANSCNRPHSHDTYVRTDR